MLHTECFDAHGTHVPRRVWRDDSLRTFFSHRGSYNHISDISRRLSLDLEPPMLPYDGEGLRRVAYLTKNMALFARVFVARVSEGVCEFYQVWTSTTATSI